MNLEHCFGDPGHMMTRSHAMITETKLARRQKLTKKVTADEEGTVFKLPRIVVEKPREVERRRFCVLSIGI